MAASVIALGACATIIPSEYLISQERLNSKLEKSFPLQRELGQGLFSATLSTPEIGFIANQNRISLALDFSAASIFNRGIRGHFALTSALRYDAIQRAVYLQDSHLETLQIEQSDAYLEVIRPLLDTMLSEYLKQNPLYRFQPDELHYAGTEIEITSIEVVPNGIKLKLNPQ